MTGLPLAYEQSYSLVLTSWSTAMDGITWQNFWRAWVNSREWQAAVADVYQEYGLDWPAIQKEWQASLH